MGDRSMRNQVVTWKWLLALLPVGVLAFGFQSVWLSQGGSGHADEDQMAVAADRAARLVELYARRMATVTSMISSSPPVVALAASSSGRPRNDAAVRATDQDWKATARRTQPSALFDEIARHEVSAYLKDLTAANGSAYREFLLADNKGRLVAASNRTEDYDQSDSDDPWWPADLQHFSERCRQAPADCAQMTDVEWDPSAAAFGFDVVMPVITQQGVTVGVLKALVDPRELDTLLLTAATNPEFDVALIRADGTRVISTGLFFKNGVPEALRSLKPGSEAWLPLTGEQEHEQRHAVVRRLNTRSSGEWSIAVAERPHDRSAQKRLFVAWASATLLLFVISAAAFSVRTDPADRPSGDRAEAK